MNQIGHRAPVTRLRARATDLLIGGRALSVLAAAACVATACGSTPGTGPATPPPASAAAGCSDRCESAASEERNKALVLRLYSEGFNQDKAAVVEELADAGYVQHSPSEPAGLAAQLEEVKTKIPGAMATVKHVAADGDLVAVHWQASATPADEMTGVAIVDLYRVGDGKLLEHWGVRQKAPAKTASGNSLFSDEYRYPNGTPHLSEDQEEKNRVFAVDAYRRLSDGDLAVLDKSWDPRYYQHNPAAGNGTAALKQLFQGAPAASGAPPASSGGTRFGNTLADGDLVWIFSSDYSVTDIFRVVDGKIIEHWDVAGG